MTDPLREALHTTAPSDSDQAFFGRLVGRWHLEWHGFTPKGGPVTTTGSLSFGWVLDGRVVQDVWAVPSVAAGPGGDATTGFHGSTLRFFDPAIDAWRSTWVEPINARVRKFIGKEHDGRLTLLSVDGDPHLRWTFLDVTTNSFTWTGECSTDGGHTWTEEERMLAGRLH